MAEAAATPPPHAQAAEGVAKGLEVDPEQGLTAEEAARRLEEDGPNQLPEQRPPSAWRILAQQFKSVLLWILLAAIVLSVVLGDAIEAVAIALITAFTVVLGFVQETRAKNAMEALRRMTAPEAHVLRDGRTLTVPAREVVRGDVLVLAAGDVVPADARLVEAADVQAAEAALTGESLPVDKAADADVADADAVADRATMVHAATTLTRGRARAVVTATGLDTEVGHIGRLLGEVESTKTPLEKQLARLGRWLLVAGGVVIVLIVILGILRGQPWTEMLVFGVALAVAAVPEALPAVVTISLALGAQRMARRNALIRRLPTVETLGSTTVICSDKTGTLTTGEMVAHQVLLVDDVVAVDDLRGGEDAPAGALLDLLRCAALCNDAEKDEAAQTVHGDPTEVALLDLADGGGIDRKALAQAWPRTAEEPFSSETARMLTSHDGPEGKVVYAKGSPKAILGLCDRMATTAGAVPMDGSAREALRKALETAAGQGMRVLAFARRDGDIPEGKASPQGFLWLGMAGLRDPPRLEARRAVQTCLEAGMRPVLITGDHPTTAAAIGKELGLPESPAVRGPDLEAMDEAELQRTVRTASLYARVSPEHKLRIVQALQAQGDVVAMTGDGVNDAPALRRADIGVAMGITGTDVAKQAASMTLADDDFASIVAAVEEGRGIFDNIRKYLIYLLSTNLGELLLIAAAMVGGLPLPLTAVMILYVNLASDGLPALALAVDPHEPDLMRRAPRRPEAGILDGPIITLMVLGGAWTAGATLGVFSYARASGQPAGVAMTMALATLVLLQFVMGFSFRTERRSVLQRPFANKWYNLAIVWEVTLLALLVYVPALNRLFGTEPLPAGSWLPVLLAVATVVPVLEVAKWIGRRRAVARSARAAERAQ